jgi:hypothetical protein
MYGSSYTLVARRNRLFAKTPAPVFSSEAGKIQEI